MTVVNVQGQIKSMLISEKLPKKNYLYILYDPTTHRKDKPKFNILLKPLSLNPHAQKVYISHNKVMEVANLVKKSIRLNMITHKY